MKESRVRLTFGRLKRVAYNEEKRLSAYIEILVECKNNANPFVFITREKNRTDNLHAPQELVFPVPKYQMEQMIDNRTRRMRDKEPFFHLGFDQIHYDFARGFKTVQFCRIQRDNKDWSANHGGLYDALFYPMGKAITVCKKEIRKYEGHKDAWRYFGSLFRPW